MLSGKMNLWMLLMLLLMVSALPCEGQIFDGTNLSSDKPYYGEPPYRFEGSENYYISFKTDPAVVRALVPEPLVPISDGKIYILFAKHKLVSPAKLDYLEAFFTIPVSFGTTFGGFMPVLYLNKTAGIIPGREIWGYNKVGADIEFDEEGDVVTVSVTQLDTLIIKATFTLGEPIAPPQESEESMVISLKHIPSVDTKAPPEIKQLTLSPLGNRTMSQLRPGKADLEFFHSAYNPLNQIPVLEILEAGFSVNSFTMMSGEVLYDYLKE